MRRRLGVALLAGLLALAPAGAALSLEVDLEPFAGGLSSPVDIAHAGDDRLFVVEQGGRIRIVESTCAAAETTTPRPKPGPCG